MLGPRRAPPRPPVRAARGPDSRPPLGRTRGLPVPRPSDTVEPPLTSGSDGNNAQTGTRLPRRRPI